jgi:hypothetical protein
MPQERNLKVSIDESVLRKLVQAVDDAANKILGRGSLSQSLQNSGSGIFDSADMTGSSLKINQKDLTIDDGKFRELTKKMLGDFEGMLASTQKMLQTVGMIDSEVGKIFQMIIQLVNTLSKGIDLGFSIIGFISNLIVPGSGSIIDGLPGSGDNTANLLSQQALNKIYPMNSNRSNVVYVIPKDTVLKGRDIYTTWAIEEKINSSVRL